MDAPTFLELKTKPQTNTNETAIVKTGFQKWHPLPDYKNILPLGKMCKATEVTYPFLQEKSTGR